MVSLADSQIPSLNKVEFDVDLYDEEVLRELVEVLCRIYSFVDCPIERDFQDM